MKKNKILFFLLIFIFALPLFAFSCNEASFDDISYTSSGRTPTEVIESINSARSQTISNEIKMKLHTTSIYNFFTVADQSITAKSIKKESTSFIGKDRDFNIFSSEENFYEDNVLLSSTNQIYEKQTVNNVTSAYCYKLHQDYSEDQENKILNAEYLRESFDYSTNTTITALYSNIVKRINANELDNVYEKTFNNETYYKMVAGVNGLENVKDKFLPDSNLFFQPELFFKNKSTDFVPSFSCEFGLKEASGAVYITYFKLDYAIYNSRYEKYLEVSSKTYLEQYGDSVIVNGVEDKGEYVANTFVNLMNKNNSYCKFNKIDDNGSVQEVSYTVLKIAKKLQSETGELNTFDYSIKVHSAQDNYYYVLSQLNDEGQVTHKTYKILDENSKTMEEVKNGLVFYLDDFDFSSKYESKNTDDSYYTFGRSENEMKVYTSSSNEITKIEKNKGNSITKLNIESYGINNSNLDVVKSISGYSEVEEG